MPQCTACTHPEREALDRDIVAGVSLRNIAAQYGLSLSAVARHRREHVAADLERAGLDRAEALAGHLRELYTRAVEILDQAEAAGDLRTALAAIAQARASLEAVARLLVADDLERRIEALEQEQTKRPTEVGSWRS